MKIIAYGSLLNQPSLERTIRRPARLRPITIPGYRRVFDAPFGDYAFANLKTSPGSIVGAAYFVLARTELAKFAEREAGSELIEVITGYWAFVWPRKLCRQLPVLQSYLDVCEVGSRQLGIDFWAGTDEPEDIVDDSTSPAYL